MEKENKKEKPKCPKCNSSFGYFRIKEKSWQCRSCGYSQKKEIDA